MPPNTILIVEDEPDLLQSLDYSIRQAGHATLLAPTGRAALELATQEIPPDLVLLDLMLPDIPGVQICRQLRANPSTRHLPIIMLTAKAEEQDRVAGFEAGADDYVVKPFSLRELLLRVNAVLRRAPSQPPSAAGVTFHDLRINPETLESWVQETPLPLTPLEFRLLEALMKRRDQVCSRAHLLEEVWSTRNESQIRTVDVYITRLREKLGEHGRHIETVRGLGYRLRE